MSPDRNDDRRGDENEPRMLRPKARVLPASAMGLDDADDALRPPLTHEMKRETDYFLDASSGSGKPDGRFPAGTRVALLKGAPRGYRRVIDARGVRAEVRSSALRKVN